MDQRALRGLYTWRLDEHRMAKRTLMAEVSKRRVLGVPCEVEDDECEVVLAVLDCTEGLGVSCDLKYECGVVLAVLTCTKGLGVPCVMEDNECGVMLAVLVAVVKEATHVRAHVPSKYDKKQLKIIKRNRRC